MTSGGPDHDRSGGRLEIAVDELVSAVAAPSPAQVGGPAGGRAVGESAALDPDELPRGQYGPTAEYGTG